MIAAIRISGQCNLKESVINTFKRLKMEKKYTCILIEKTDVVRLGMIKSLKDYLIYGEVSDELANELKAKRDKGKGVFFLHPAVGGLKKSSKLAYPKGILGKNKEIGKLLERMI